MVLKFIEKQKGVTYGTLGLVRAKDSHTATHELFHLLIHKHQNASKENQELIDPNNQDPGHFIADGIFIYADDTKNIKIQDLNQKNINDALKTIPEIK